MIIAYLYTLAECSHNTILELIDHSSRSNDAIAYHWEEMF